MPGATRPAPARRGRSGRRHPRSRRIRGVRQIHCEQTIIIYYFDDRKSVSTTPASVLLIVSYVCFLFVFLGIHDRGVQWEGGAVDGGSNT